MIHNQIFEKIVKNKKKYLKRFDYFINKIFF